MALSLLSLVVRSSFPGAVSVEVRSRTLVLRLADRAYTISTTQQVAQLIAALTEVVAQIGARSCITRSGGDLAVAVFQEPGVDDPVLDLGQEVPGHPEEGVTPASTALTWRSAVTWCVAGISPEWRGQDCCWALYGVTKVTTLA